MPFWTRSSRSFSEFMLAICLLTFPAEDREHVSHKVFSICLAESCTQDYEGIVRSMSSGACGYVVSRWGGQFNVGGYDESLKPWIMVVF